MVIFADKQITYIFWDLFFNLLKSVVVQMGVLSKSKMKLVTILIEQ